MLEEWLPVVGWERDLEVSNFGNVRRRGSLCIVKQRRTQSNRNRVWYRAIWIAFPDGRKLLARIHVLVAAAFIGPRTGVINHLDGNGENNSVGNLEYTTHRENVIDGLKRSPRRSLCKLGQGRAVELRRRYLAGEHTAALAVEFGVCRSTVVRAANGRTWKF